VRVILGLMPTFICDNCGKHLSMGDLDARVKIDFGNKHGAPVRAVFCATCANAIAKPLPNKARVKGRRLTLPRVSIM
jgi:hypothetical protein